MFSCNADLESVCKIGNCILTILIDWSIRYCETHNDKLFHSPTFLEALKVTFVIFICLTTCITLGVSVDGHTISRDNTLKILGVTLEDKLNFNAHILYLNGMFINKESIYNLRDQSRLLQPKFNTKRYGYRSFQYFGSKIWNSLPASIKDMDNLGMFKQHLFNWCLTDHANRLMEQLEL